jgi:hypothetical protein
MKRDSHSGKSAVMPVLAMEVNARSIITNAPCFYTIIQILVLII